MAPPNDFQLSLTSDSAPARKARPAIQTISNAMANIPAMVPAISIGGGSLGRTVANFTGGDKFTLTPEDREAGWLGRLRLIGGGDGFRAGGEASVEDQNGRAALGFRATLSVGF